MSTIPSSPSLSDCKRFAFPVAIPCPFLGLQLGLLVQNHLTLTRGDVSYLKVCAATRAVLSTVSYRDLKSLAHVFSERCVVIIPGGSYWKPGVVCYEESAAKW